MTDPHDEHSHPDAGEYIQIGIILAVITAVEVALFYVDLMRAIVIPALLTLTFVKFALVVMWFMHLRFDSPWFRRMILAGLALAATVFSVTAIVMQVTPGA